MPHINQSPFTRPAEANVLFIAWLETPSRHARNKRNFLLFQLLQTHPTSPTACDYHQATTTATTTPNPPKPPRSLRRSLTPWPTTFRTRRNRYPLNFLPPLRAPFHVVTESRVLGPRPRAGVHGGVPRQYTRHGLQRLIAGAIGRPRGPCPRDPLRSRGP